MAAVVRFLVLTIIVPFVLILSAMPRHLRELMHFFFYFFIFLHFKGIMAFGILNNFLLGMRLIES